MADNNTAERGGKTSSYQKRTFTANPRPKPGSAQSSVTFDSELEYNLSFATCHPNSPNMKVATKNQVHFASTRLAKALQIEEPALGNICKCRRYAGA
ncbi:uncharacterized protein BDCG_06289 [Blastomyces dermatitidis ER-3]|uniref:Uncharacterized protein n=2 Tax=Blastomyces TaxID=229219 RepID=A0A179U7Y7_BLAGS|nr:uncharacterized protein BDBG_00740 [Blastomyces gilchristii SLH14081]XP_045277752.1 uncharacterized protein BDCG_06289 [Blastomyces dermatitidis ER-3]EEQ91169.2 hypothetical protein BDCG_06289 [Blastomyces dermatitidis ER-3]EQL30627.1 hypothetical protein BDFG_06892 [Blastomyces dermatitidis ATCC 26199]OAT04116.1 hypothetical protein BDBG_00740 [Blastomyces gilchristii SLH14081]